MQFTQTLPGRSYQVWAQDLSGEQELLVVYQVMASLQVVTQANLNLDAALRPKRM
jgi:hypothetical protein